MDWVSAVLPPGRDVLRAGEVDRGRHADEPGELAAALADRVVALETEVKELRGKLGDAE